MKKIKLLITTVLTFAFGFSAVAGDKSAPTIVGAAIGSPQFSTLVKAVSKAGLVDILNGHRQFTVFAPTNTAFDLAATAIAKEDDSIPDDLTGEGLVDLLPVDALTEILLYHVAPGERFSEDVTGATRIRTMAKSFLFVDGTTLVGENSSAALDLGNIDLDVKNGVIHTIEFVLLP